MLAYVRAGVCVLASGGCVCVRVGVGVDVGVGGWVGGWVGGCGCALGSPLSYQPKPRPPVLTCLGFPRVLGVFEAVPRVKRAGLQWRVPT